ncbi:phosphonate C-P lyase system protein PhnH [Brevibacterium album]|uniref:phosphonate C-P lyase system protein PhnH n=1 Tax=Brevibacterium album TaxID=417948 RepID=UPI0004101653|nr:phosphonate C-P lyase system protein PhnH [Brevibacterium album]
MMPHPAPAGAGPVTGRLAAAPRAAHGAAEPGTPGAAELGTAEATAVFRACLTALAHPGRLAALPQTGPPQTARHPVLLPVLALADLMVSVAAVDSAGRDDAEATAELARVTGARPAEPAAARIVLAGGEGAPDDGVAAALLGRVHPGTPEAPHHGALIVLAVAGLRACGPDEAPAQVAVQAPAEAQAPGTAAEEVWELTGPGVDGAARVAVMGPGEGFRAARAAVTAGFPTGVDVLCVAPGGTLLGLPRTTALAPVRAGAPAAPAPSAAADAPEPAPTTGEESAWATQE